MDISKTLQEALGDDPKPQSHHLSGIVVDEPQRSVQELLGALESASTPGGSCASLGVWESNAEDVPLALRVWKLDLSPGTKYRLAKKQAKKDKPKKIHYKTRRKEFRRRYWQRLRQANLDGKRRRSLTPAGVWQMYKQIATKKNTTWALTKEELETILLQEHSDGVPILYKIFNIERIDKDKAIGYTCTNIRLVDRYNKSLIYYVP